MQLNSLVIFTLFKITTKFVLCLLIKLPFTHFSGACCFNYNIQYRKEKKYILFIEVHLWVIDLRGKLIAPFSNDLAVVLNDHVLRKHLLANIKITMFSAIIITSLNCSYWRYLIQLRWWTEVLDISLKHYYHYDYVLIFDKYVLKVVYHHNVIAKKILKFYYKDIDVSEPVPPIYNLSLYRCNLENNKIMLT